MCKGFFRRACSTLRPAGAALVARICGGGHRDADPGQKNADHVEELTRLTGELAHEIKNPLSTIKVNLKLAEEALRDVDLSDPGRVLWDSCRRNLTGAARKIGIVQKETDRLEQILEGFLKYVRRPDLQLETVDLNELVGDMIDFYSPQAYSYSLTVRQSLINEPLVCRVDAGALKQVLLNLFINAQQAMSGGGDLMIHTSRQGKLAVVVVNDTGRGIAPERLATLFQPYQSSRSGGMGLGLATAKKIIEAHEGHIQVHSELGKGTSFTISLPLAQVDASSTERIG
ncbi:MAG TPA: ATP-binding protein [Sedimentisphaerales bacterium]|nr:ATP-binding protein [Sedimentisphaerales bacterium]HNU30673.1 ATP-binding protein [Sedimentisphaerales bacterium]